MPCACLAPLLLQCCSSIGRLSAVGYFFGVLCCDVWCRVVLCVCACQATAGANFETRGNFHYRSGLNSIPLLEWYRIYPDDFFLAEVALGAHAGQMNNIDETGAPGMMMHMEPH
eukprot:SAG11_NODE_7964_length_1077_cov_0.968303_1_plen_113_part_10